MAREQPDTAVKVAVIGTGLAGLTTAHLLQTLPFEAKDGSKVKFQVHIFDKSETIGMDSSSVTVKTDSGSFRLDTPMRSINGGSHSRVLLLYKFVGSKLRRSNFSYSFSRLLPAPKASTKSPRAYSATNGTSPSARATSSPSSTPQDPLFLYEGSNGFRWPPLTFPSTVTSTLARLKHLSHLLLLALSYFHLLFLAFFYNLTGLTGREKSTTGSWTAQALGIRNVANEPLDQWCTRHKVWKGMREEVLEPLYAAVSTVGRAEVGALPIGEILDYIVDTFGSSHYVSANGVEELVNLLVRPIPTSQLHLSTSITSLSPTPSSPSRTRLHFGTSHLDFDHIIFATQANQAKSLLKLYQTSLSSPDEKAREQPRLDALGTFTYATCLVVNHYDTTLLPAPADRRDLNLVTCAPAATYSTVSTPMTLPPSSVQATHIISRTHPSLAKSLPPTVELLQTTNPIVEIDPTKVISATWYERAMVCPASKRVLSHFVLPAPASARRSEADFQGRNGIWFVGSWCADGLPLLEGCVESAERVVVALAGMEGVKTVIPF